MKETPRHFEVDFIPFDDSIMVEMINIKSREEKTAEKSDIILPDTFVAPKNIAEIERMKADKQMTYEMAEKDFLAKWEEYPNQGLVVAVGPGRPVEDGVKIPIQAKKGDIVFIRGRSGEPIIYKKKVYFIVKPHEIFGKVPKK